MPQAESLFMQTYNQIISLPHNSKQTLSDMIGYALSQSSLDSYQKDLLYYPAEPDMVYKTIAARVAIVNKHMDAAITAYSAIIKESWLLNDPLLHKFALTVKDSLESARITNNASEYDKAFKSYLAILSGHPNISDKTREASAWAKVTSSILSIAQQVYGSKLSQAKLMLNAVAQSERLNNLAGLLNKKYPSGPTLDDLKSY